MSRCIIECVIDSVTNIDRWMYRFIYLYDDEGKKLLKSIEDGINQFANLTTTATSVANYCIVIAIHSFTLLHYLKSPLSRIFLNQFIFLLVAECTDTSM